MIKHWKYLKYLLKHKLKQCDDIHDWEYSSWGIIIGVSKCKKCGKVSTRKDFDIVLPMLPFMVVRENTPEIEG